MKRLKLSDRSMVPPASTWATEDGLDVTIAGYAYYQSGTGTTFSSPDFDNLLGKVVKHRIANGIPVPPDLSDELEDAICRHSRAKCEPRDTVQADPAVHRDFNLIALVKRFLFCVVVALRERPKAEVLVDQAEADRRAEICLGCTRNVEIKGCWGCNGATNLLFNVLGGQKSRFHEKLKSCGVCGCSNKAQVFVSGAVLAQCSGDLDYPEATSDRPGAPECWKRTAINNQNKNNEREENTFW